MATSYPFPSWWGPKQYILAAIAGTLVASAIVIVTSVVLSPAKIYFSVTGASSSPADAGQGVYLNFTVTADNPSHRAGVQYRIFMVSLMQFSEKNRMESMEAKVRETVPFYQPPASSRSMLVTAFFASHVRGKVRFKVWLAYSRLYVVTVECAPFDIFSGAGKISSTNPSATTVKCVP
ncbi:hypothetical protein E2562_016254 [Oryza meyeriana var. granulata]|uniref:Uncharacterized protein n=1 Tax=Oryza meyeriana var. granulata TaxID=110450 RepID=A0A6G1CQM5_9ORYZ|nr:hypothetical protein E2562_016254 [Oryza meyeriana var. granulata]